MTQSNEPPVSPAAPAQPAPAAGLPQKTPADNPWQAAEEGWAALIAAAAKIQRAVNALKQTEHSIHAYNIERALNKHKPPLMQDHYRGLQDFRKENKV